MSRQRRQYVAAKRFDSQDKEECLETSRPGLWTRLLNLLKLPGSNCVYSGHKSTYLGNVPTSQRSSTDQGVALLWEKLQHENMILEDVYLDIQSRGLVMYHVNEVCRITRRRWFDLARISFCSAHHQHDPCLFAWVYHQETNQGFQMQCHVVRTPTDRKARFLAVKLNSAFRNLYEEVQAAVKSSKIFSKACEQAEHRGAAQVISWDKQAEHRGAAHVISWDTDEEEGGSHSGISDLGQDMQPTRPRDAIELKICGKPDLIQHAVYDLHFRSEDTDLEAHDHDSFL